MHIMWMHPKLWRVMVGLEWAPPCYAPLGPREAMSLLRWTAWAARWAPLRPSFSNASMAGLKHHRTQFWTACCVELVGCAPDCTLFVKEIILCSAFGTDWSGHAMPILGCPIFRNPWHTEHGCGPNRGSNEYLWCDSIMTLLSGAPWTPNNMLPQQIKHSTTRAILGNCSHMAHTKFVLQTPLQRHLCHLSVGTSEAQATM